MPSEAPTPDLAGPTAMPTDPASPNRRRRRRVKGAVAIVVVLLLVAAAAVATLLWYGDRQIGTLDVETQIPGDTDGDGVVDAPELRDVVNILVAGSDSRDDLTADQRQELGTGDFEGVRTDTVMVVQMDPRREGPAVLSLPRDLLVERCDGSQGRINGAYEIGAATDVGGPTCLVRTVQTLTGIPIHHYVELDFQGFVDVVDAMGGVDLCLGRPISDEDANIDLPAGCQTLNGPEALGFVRVRNIDSDLGRISRQQRFLAAVADQVTSPRMAVQPGRLLRLIETGAQAVEADHGLSIGFMRRIAATFSGATADTIDMRTVPAVDETIDGVAYLVPDPKPAEELFAAFRSAQAPPEGVGVDRNRDITDPES
ncbi:MAG TPA: LCP family protein [Egibacteraceae bacterium]|nr:LCP family protein [Egibacteraceae bacterium]